MNEWAIFLTRLEFVVLLLLEGIEEINCFSLPKETEVDAQHMLQTIYELNKSGFLKTEENTICLADNIKFMMDLIKNAKTYFRMEPEEDSFYQKICYVSEKIVVLENVQQHGKAFRLFVMEKKDFWNWLENSLNLPAVLVERKQDMMHLLEMNDLIFQEQKKLQTVQYPGTFYDIKDFMEQAKRVSTVFAGIRFVDQKTKMIYKDMVIVQGSFHLWFLWCDTDFFEEEQIMHIAADCLEFRQEQLKTFWREKK